MIVQRGQCRDESLLPAACCYSGFGRCTEREMLFMGARMGAGVAKSSH